MTTSHNLTRCSAPAPTDSDSPSRRTMNAIDDHHRKLGAALKYIEAAITGERFTTYLNDREIDKAFANIVKAIQQARPVLDRRRCNGGFYHVGPGGDAYFGPELDALHKLAYKIEPWREINREKITVARQVDREMPLEDDGGIRAAVIRRWRRLQLADAERAPLPDCLCQEPDEGVGDVLAAARQQSRLLPETSPVALLPAADEPAMRAEPHHNHGSTCRSMPGADREPRPASDSVRQAVPCSPEYGAADQARARRGRRVPGLDALARTNRPASRSTGRSCGLNRR